MSLMITTRSVGGPHGRTRWSEARRLIAILLKAGPSMEPAAQALVAMSARVAEVRAFRR